MDGWMDDDRWMNDGWMKRGEGAIFCLLAFLSK